MFDLFSEKRTILEQDGKVEILENLFEVSKSDHLLSALIDEINWKQEHITLFSKTHPVPRLQAWYADPGYNYAYSNIDLEVNPWSDTLLEIKKTVETQTNQSFNSVLINYYRDGSDYAAWHSDDEKELGKNPTIASLSLGAKRMFHLKHKSNKGIEIFKFELPHNSLLIMSGTLQHHWKHQLAKTSKPVLERINLTFRTIIQ